MAKQLKDVSVLVVDDNAQARQLLKMVLSGLGVHQIYTATDGRAAQDFLGEMEGLVDLIICDWRMPRMTGLELLQQVRSIYPDMPFMMVTGKTDVQAVMSAKEFGVDAYVAKPFSPQEFEKKLTIVGTGYNGKLKGKHLELQIGFCLPKTIMIPEGIKVEVVDQFNQPKQFDVKKPNRLCNPVDKNDEDIINLEAHLMCYKVKRAEDEPKHEKVKGIRINNQFGPLQIDTKKEEELCVPSTKTLP